MSLTEEDKQWISELLEEHLKRFETSLALRRETARRKASRPKLRIKENYYLYIDQISSIEYIPAPDMTATTVKFIATGEERSSEPIGTESWSNAFDLPQLPSVLTINPNAGGTIKLMDAQADDVWQQYREHLIGQV